MCADHGRSWGSSRAYTERALGMACSARTRARGAKIVCPTMKNEWNKCKNHFSEMKGDVGLSLHEKERNKMPTPRHKVTHNPIPTSLFLPRRQHTFSCRQLDMLLCLMHSSQINKQHVKAKQRCRDGVMSDFVSWCRHLLFPFFFMK